MSALAKAIAIAEHEGNNGAGYTLGVTLMGGMYYEVDVYMGESGHLFRRRSPGATGDRNDIVFNDAAVMSVEVLY